MENLEAELKQLIIDTLELEGISPMDIVSYAPLFGEGLGLDSIDALELGVTIQKKYGVKIDPQDKNLASHFQTVKALAAFIEKAK